MSTIMKYELYEDPNLKKCAFTYNIDSFTRVLDILYDPEFGFNRYKVFSDKIYGQDFETIIMN